MKSDEGADRAALELQRPANRPICIVCNRKLRAPIYNDAVFGLYGEGTFCTRICAVFYARATVKVLRKGDLASDAVEARIKTKLCDYPWIEKRRGA